MEYAESNNTDIEEGSKKGYMVLTYYIRIKRRVGL
jgi:hypothetical protein